MSKKLHSLVIALVILGLVAPAIAQPGKGFILVERWVGGGVSDNLTTLKNNANYPDNPVMSFWDDNYDQPDLSANDYWGERYRGYIQPLQTGDYTFWIASDDYSEFWLSTDDKPGNITLICSVEGWTDYQNYAGTTGVPGANQKSKTPIKLEAGKRYYTEAMFSDGTGGGHMSVAWAGPGIGTSPTFIAGKYLFPWIRDPEPMFNAREPNPANNATGVLMPGITILSWTKGVTAGAHDVYFGTDPNPPKIIRQTSTTFFHMVPLTPGTTYYWRVDEIESSGTIHQGEVWSFVAAPLSAFGPTPRNGDKWIDPDGDLVWQPGTNAASHDVYFSTDKNAVAGRDASVKKGDKLPVPQLDLPTLVAGTVYYWLVDEYDTSDVKHEGEVWSFTINTPGGGVKAEYFRNMAASGAPFLTQIETEINHNWPDGSGPAAGVTDQFSARWTADLEIAIADDYTFIGTSDDGIRAWLDDVQIVNRWVDQGTTDSFSAPQHLEPGIYALVVEYYENGAGAVAQFSWQTPNIARQIIPAGPLQPPVRAKPTNPGNGDANVPQDITLMWSSGENAVTHEVYFGEDAAAVEAATTADAAIYQGSQALDKNTFAPGALEWNKTYYWRVDEVNTASADSPWKGSVWKFTTADFLVVDNFESYTDESPSRVFQTWIDGWGFSADDFFSTDNPGNASGATVGHDIWTTGTPYGTIMETSTVNPGGSGQSVPFDFNNIVQPYYSETDRTWASPQNWKVNGVNTLVLYFRGYPVRFLNDGTTITMSAAGNDIWNNADQFRFAFKTLTGDGSITAKINSIVQTDVWAKAGVMIRDTLAPGATNAATVVSAASGVSFQHRTLSDDVSANTGTGALVAPYWVRLTRTGNTFKGEMSADGKTWTIVGTDATLNPHDVIMSSTVDIGLCVTSHNTSATIVTIGVFSDVTTTGNVTGAWTLADVGITHPGNDLDQLYVAVEDSSKKLAIVKHPDPQAVLSTVWTAWEIPLSAFTGVNTGAVKKMYIGVGDRTAPKPDGHGTLIFDDIRVIKK